METVGKIKFTYFANNLAPLEYILIYYHKQISHCKEERDNLLSAVHMYDEFNIFILIKLCRLV